MVILEGDTTLETKVKVAIPHPKAFALQTISLEAEKRELMETSFQLTLRTEEVNAW